MSMTSWRAEESQKRSDEEEYDQLQDGVFMKMARLEISRRCDPILCSFEREWKISKDLIRSLFVWTRPFYLITTVEWSVDQHTRRVEKKKSSVTDRGGTIGTKIDFLKVFKWILLWFQYIRPGKKEFLNLVTVLNLHIDHQNFENHYVRVKNQSCRRPMVWPIQTWARRALSHWEKN